MPEQPSGHPLRALVADDYRDAADSLALLAREWGHQALVAYDGPAALDLARARPPDVAFLDMHLAGRIDGCELARRLRQLPGGDRTLLVAVTGLGGQQELRRHQEAGIDCHFLKPVGPERLRLLAEAARLGPARRRGAC